MLNIIIFISFLMNEYVHKNGKYVNRSYEHLLIELKIKQRLHIVYLTNKKIFFNKQ